MILSRFSINRAYFHGGIVKKQQQIIQSKLLELNLGPYQKEEVQP